MHIKSQCHRHDHPLPAAGQRPAWDSSGGVNLRTAPKPCSSEPCCRAEWEARAPGAEDNPPLPAAILQKFFAASNYSPHTRDHYQSQSELRALYALQAAGSTDASGPATSGIPNQHLYGLIGGRISVSCQQKYCICPLPVWSLCRPTSPERLERGLNLPSRGALSCLFILLCARSS